jgi:predicted outer membrane repeat protein
MFSGLNFIGGSSNFGGALDIYDAKVTISNCNFTGAYASNNGGCIANLGGNLIIGNSFFNNCSSGHNGGSINCFNGDLTLTNSFFANCKCDYDGGVISLNNYSSANIIGNFFINNTAGEWGACVYEWNAITVNTKNNIFISNNAKKGACLFIYGANNITSNVFENNNADYGAGVYVEEAYGSVLSSVECNFNSFINNTAPTGGAIYAIDGYTQNAHGICNTSIFISNTASEKYGGAIDTSDISINVNYCSFINNTSISQGETINYKHYSVGSFNYDYNWWGNNTPFNNGSN